MATQELLLFRKWSASEIEIKDPGLKTAISLKKIIYPMDFGRSALKRFNKADVNIVERLVNKMMHFGKKYAKNTGRICLLYTSPSPRDGLLSRMPSSA